MLLSAIHMGLSQLLNHYQIRWFTYRYR